MMQVEIRITLEVNTPEDGDADKLAKAFVEDAIGETGRTHYPHFSEKLRGATIQVRAIRTERL